MKFVNLTKTPLTIEGIGAVPPSGGVARLVTHREQPRTKAGVRITAIAGHAVLGLPAPVDGVSLIVSAPVLAFVRGHRPDVFGPDTGPDAVRENGKVTEVRGLIH